MIPSDDPFESLFECQRLSYYNNVSDSSSPVFDLSGIIENYTDEHTYHYLVL